MEVVNNTYLPGDPRLIDHIVYELKSQGIFDNLRKECIADVDTKPAYQNLRQRVEGSVSGFLKSQRWRSDMNKNQVREMLRKNISESGFLETGVERIVDQVVNPKINTIFLPQVENVVYKVLGIQKPTAFDDLKKDMKSDIKLDLLPNDLEAISPESESQEKKMDVSNESQKFDEKMDEDDSPPFEPIELPVTHEENSVDSNVSGISGLISHESNHSVENENKELPPVELSNPDSQLSKQSSDDQLSVAVCEEQDMKLEINDDSNASRVSSTKAIDTSVKSVDVPDSQSSSETVEITSSTEKAEEIKKVEEKRSSDKKSDKHHSSHRHSSHKSKYDNKDRKSGKDRKSDKDKRDHHSSKSSDSSSRKDKDKKSKSDKDQKHGDSKSSSSKDKERERSSSGHRHSKEKSSKRESHESKSKESSGHKDSKTTSSESKSSKDNKEEKSRSHSSSKKSKDDRSHSKHNGKSSSDSIKTSSKDNKKSSDKSDKKDKHPHSSSDRKSDKGDKDKQDSRKDVRKDDHYSLKEKRSHRRSTDRDSSDGQSGTHSSSGSLTDLTTPSQLQKSSQESSVVDSGASTGADSGNSDAIISLLSQPADIASIPCIVSEEENARVLSNKVPHLKLIKPKFASNIFEAKRLMKIRKKLGKLEKQKQMELLSTNSSLIHNVTVNNTTLAKNKNDSVNSTASKKLAQTAVEPENKVEEVNLPADEETSLQTSVISKESWDAIEAKLNAQNILKVDYNSYVDASETIKDHKVEQKEVETKKEDNTTNENQLTSKHNFKGFDKQLVEEAELCLNKSSQTITQWESDLAKLSKAYLIGLAEKDKSRLKKSTEEFSDFNRLPKVEVVDVTSNEIIISPGRGIKRISNDHSDVHNNNKISKELGDLLSVKLSRSTIEPGSTPKHKGKKAKLMDSAVNTLENFNLPLSPADSEKSFNSVNEKRNEVLEGRPRRNRAANKQRYSSDDLYKPRMQFTSTRRRTTNIEKN